MSKYLEVLDDVVVNICVWDGVSDYAPAGITLVPCDEHPEVSIGWRREGTEWVPPNVPVPSSVTMRQARLYLLNAGLLNSVEQAIAGINNQAASIEWQFSQTVQRDSPLVAEVSSILGLDNDNLDLMFIEANRL